jgi:pimeloyl-ACP methyl ester carboxylesterase
MTTTSSLNPPPRLLQLLEGRALAELGGTLAAWPLLQWSPRGDGHPVLVLPGLAASDTSTRLLRRFLAERGYEVHGWGLGRNFGPRAGVREAMLARLGALHERTGRKPSLVGWSLGGMYARWLAVQRPEAVRNVVTLGSPITGAARASNAWRLYEFTSGRRAEGVHHAPPPGVPVTSIFSRSDGVVAWRASVQPAGPLAESIEVPSSHLGLGVNATVLYAIADRLAQPEGEWKPFERPRWATRELYPDPYR